MRPDWIPKPEDELLHEPWGDESLPWKDTWYFSALDADSGVHLTMHMTVSANRAPDTRIAVGARDRGREAVAIRREDGQHDERSIGNSLAAIEIVSLSWDSRHQVRWRAQAGEFSFDVLVCGVHFAPFFDAMFPAVNPTGRRGHSYSHTEQVIRTEGHFAWAGEEQRPVAGIGWRDRGWGRRKTELTFGTGYDLIGGILPDGSAFALSAMRNVEHGPDAPLPIYGFLTDEAGVVPAVSGVYHKDSQSFPSRIGLEFADGRRIDAEQVRRLSTLASPFHDAEPEHVALAVNARDYYALLEDPSGAQFPVFSNEGHATRANVTGEGRFYGPDDAAPAS